MRKYLFLLAFFIAGSLAAQSGKPADPSIPPPQVKRGANEPPPALPDIAALEKAELDRLRTNDPKTYEQYLDIKRTQEKINQILSDYHGSVITKDEASDKLYPLVKIMAKPEIEMLPKRIAKLRETLDFLVEAKRNPSRLIDRRVQQLLSAPNEGPNPMDMIQMEP